MFWVNPSLFYTITEPKITHHPTVQPCLLPSECICACVHMAPTSPFNTIILCHFWEQLKALKLTTTFTPFHSVCKKAQHVPTSVCHAEESDCLTVHICATMWIILVKAKVKAAIFDCWDQPLLQMTVNKGLCFPLTNQKEI